MPSDSADKPATLPNPPSVASAPNPLARQLRQVKIVALLLLLALLGGVGGALWVRHIGQPVVILLDGKAITRVRSAAAANALLVQAEHAKVGVGYAEDSIVRLQLVQMQPLAANSLIDPDHIAIIKLRNALRLHVHAYAIVVNGQVSVGLPTNAMAVDTIHLVKEHFTDMPPPEELIGEPAIVEHIVIKLRAVEGSLARASSADAAPYFWTPPPSRTYIVRRGDTGLVIARRNHISFTDFITANAGHDINRLAPGTAVNVQKMPLLLTVRVKKKFTREEKILANVPESDAGLRQVTYAVTYLNGQETHRDVLAMSTINEPAPRTTL